MLKILVVEDENSIQDMFRELLLDHCHLTFANNGNVGLSLTQEEDFDIIITDEVMPEMNGTEMIKEIRKIDASIFVIIISGKLNSSFQADDADADYFLTKPFNVNDIIELINDIFDENIKLGA